jgi:hypothetical protein
MSHPPPGCISDGHANDLSHLQPDRLRIGGVAVFAGDWAWVEGPNGPRIPVGFVGTFIDTFFRTTKIIDSSGPRGRDCGQRHLLGMQATLVIRCRCWWWV